MLGISGHDENVPARTVSVENVDAALKPVIRRGLPVTPETAGDLLPDLRCAYALAVHPEDRLSRVTALDELLRELLNQLGDADFGRATRLLFAHDATAAVTKLTVRRRRAAELMGYDPDHFRKRIEPKLRQTVVQSLVWRCWSADASE